LKCDGTRTETRFRLSPKRTSPFKSAGASVHSTAGSRDVRISVRNAGYTTFRGSVRVLATHSIRHFPLHFPSRALPRAIRFQTHSTKLNAVKERPATPSLLTIILSFRTTRFLSLVVFSQGNLREVTNTFVIIQYKPAIV
jgi:hypothetical protein